MKILLLKPSNHFLRYSAWEAKFHLDLQSTAIYKSLNLLVSFKMEERNEDEKRPDLVRVIKRILEKEK